MKRCISCNQTVEANVNFCPVCGKNDFINEDEPKVNSPQKSCPHCNTAITERDAVFCPSCGRKIAEGQQQVQPAFLQSLKSDLQGSKSIDMIKSTAHGTVEKVKSADAAKKKKGKLAVIIVAVVLVALLVVSNIHTCEECDEVYFGKKHKISFWGESENVCKDCYEDFHSFS